MELSEDALWADADAASCGDCLQDAMDSETEDAYGNCILEERARYFRESFVRLPCGDIHLCNTNCKFAEVTKDGCMACPYSGIVTGMASVERTDFSTGRSTWSVDPDANSGQPVGGTWRKKTDGVAMSKQAMAMANSFDDTQLPKAHKITRVDHSTTKKGARCLDETETDPGDVTDHGSGRYKKPRTSKREMSADVESAKLLVIEADSIYDKLIVSNNVESGSEGYERPSANETTSSTPPTPPTPPNLPSFNKLFELSLTRYVQAVRDAGERPNLDRVHDLALGVRAAVEDVAKKAACADMQRVASKSGQRSDQKGEQNICVNVKFRSIFTRLTVAMWTGACGADFFALNKRGCDSYRPFVAGCLFALKRGLSLQDGTALIPPVPQVASAIITSKQATDNAQLKSLAASCHRGLSFVHRSISSVPVNKQRVVFADALQLSRELQALLH